MKLIVNPHKVDIVKEPVNEREINITKCEFEFADEITNDYVKEAYFTFNGATYKQIIVNNECDIPSEVLTEKGQVELGVVAFLVENEEEIKRYNPSPAYFESWAGSLKDNAENSEPITPSDKEQMEQAIQDMEAKVDNLDIDAEKVGNTSTITITRQDETQKSVEIFDGINGKDGKNGKDGIDGKDGKDGQDGANGVGLNYNWQDTSLGVKREDEQNYSYVDLKGDQGDRGPQGVQGPVGATGSAGNGITNIRKINTTGLRDTYAISYTNGNTDTFDVTNGLDGLNVVDKDNDDQILASSMTLKDNIISLNVIQGNQPYNRANTYAPLMISAGEPKISNDYISSRGFVLKCFGNRSTQLTQKDTSLEQYGHKYYVSADIYCVRYSAGYFGVVFSSASVGYLGVQGTTNGFVKMSNIITTNQNPQTASKNATLFVGSWSSANLDAYIDNIMVNDLTKLFGVGNEPTLGEMNNAFAEFLNIANGVNTTKTLFDTAITVNGVTYTYKEVFIDGNDLGVCTFDEVPAQMGGTDETITFKLSKKENEYTDEQCRTAFVEYMNSKAVDIGMTSSNFINASGYAKSNGNTYSHNTSTAKDLLHLLVHASGVDKLCEIWYKDQKDILIRNKLNNAYDSRTISLISSVKNATFENSYYIFGGKTGTLTTGLQTPTYNLMIDASAPDNNWFAGVIVQSNSDANRFSDMKEMLDVATNVYNNPNYDTSSVTLNAQYACVCLMPINNPVAYDQYNLPLLFSKNETQSCYPASISKVLTAICVLDFVTDLNEKITIKTSDITSGSGPTFYNGDIISYKDALYAMMLPSSNTIAELVSREVGRKILQSKEI